MWGVFSADSLMYCFMHRACPGFLLVALQRMSLELSHHVSAIYSIMYGVSWPACDGC